MLGRDNLDFSFSGLKTAVRHVVQNEAGGRPDPQFVKDLAASFQAAVADVLADRCARALDRFQEAYGRWGPLIVAGGVAANAALRARLDKVAANSGTRMIAPPPALCTDNAAMIAWAGVERLRRSLTDPLDFAPRPRWPLEDLRDSTGAASTGAAI
jgi:N6-L-threonylcarbamoyladenine synthase